LGAVGDLQQYITMQPGAGVKAPIGVLFHFFAFFFFFSFFGGV
jgi:hypothetical protein